MEFVFVYRTATDGRGDCRSASVFANSLPDAWVAFYENTPDVVWARYDTVRKPLFSRLALS